MLSKRYESTVYGQPKGQIKVPRDVQNSKSENMISSGENGLPLIVIQDSFSPWTWPRFQTGGA